MSDENENPVIDLSVYTDERLGELAAEIDSELIRRRLASLPDLTEIACGIAAGRRPASPDALGCSIRASHRDLNARGNGPEWHRMVWRGMEWRYFSDERLPARGDRAHQRRATVHGEVFPGEIVVEHDRGAPVDSAYLVTCDEKPLKTIQFKKIRSGELKFELPDGSEIKLPNPRKRG